jgi:hypothetical protein
MHISCTANTDSDKYDHYHHQQFILVHRNRFIQSQQQQQRINPTIKPAYL